MKKFSVLIFFLIGCAVIQKNSPIIRLGAGDQNHAEKHIILRLTNDKGMVMEEYDFYFAKGEVEKVIDSRTKYEYREPTLDGSDQIKAIYPGVKIMLKFFQIRDHEKISIQYNHMQLKVPADRKKMLPPQYTIKDLNNHFIPVQKKWSLLGAGDGWVLEYYFEGK